MLARMADPDVRVERLDGDHQGVALLTVSDPKRRNAMTTALSDRLVAVLDEVGADTAVHAVVITGDDDPSARAVTSTSWPRRASPARTRCSASTPGSWRWPSARCRRSPPSTGRPWAPG
jgi:Enoyl-CoA hydratase/isomerase